MVGYNVGDHSKPGEDEDVDLWVTKESEEVLVQDWVSPSSWVEEGCVKISIR